MEKMIKTIEDLNKFPEIGRLIPEAEEEDIRELLFHIYRIIYRVKETRILILAVIYGSRDLTQKEPKPGDIV